MKRLNRLRRIAMSIFLASAAVACTDQLALDSVNSSNTTISATATTGVADCSTCTYVVPATATIVDGVTLKLGPGSVICLNAANAYKSIIFRNLIGTATSPIIIRNCGGTAVLDGTGKGYVIRTETSKYFRIT